MPLNFDASAAMKVDAFHHDEMTAVAGRGRSDGRRTWKVRELLAVLSEPLLNGSGGGGSGGSGHVEPGWRGWRGGRRGGPPARATDMPLAGLYRAVAGALATPAPKGGRGARWWRPWRRCRRPCRGGRQGPAVGVDRRVRSRSCAHWISGSADW